MSIIMTMENKRVRCGTTSDLAFWDFFQTEEGYICESCEPGRAKDFMEKQNEES